MKTSASGSRAIMLLLSALALAGFIAGSAGTLFATYAYRRELQASLDPAGAAPAPFVARPGEFVLVGDSRAHAWPHDAFEGDVHQFAAVGHTTAQTLARLMQWGGGIGAGAIAIVQVGINDLKAIGALPDQEAVIIERCRENIREIVDTLHAKGCRVVLTTVFPPKHRISLARRVFWSPGVPRAVATVNKAILGMAREGVIVVDCDPLLTVDGALSDAYAIDDLHLSDAAYTAIMAKLRTQLAQQTPTP